MGDTRPIGVFDSGIGGLSVLKEIHQLLPHERFIYVGDAAHAPYGDRSKHYVRQRSQAIADFLLDQGVKTIVIACNTATAVAATPLRQTMDVPVIGLEPAIKPAAQHSKNGIIGVLATQRTINSDRLLGLTERYAKNIKVIAQACPGLVEQVEACDLDSHTTRTLLETYLHPLLKEGVDALILGCTHYPFLLPLIRDILSDDATHQQIDIFDTGKPVAQQVKRILTENQLLAPASTPKGDQQLSDYKPRITFYNSSDQAQSRRAMQTLWPYPINPIHLPLL